MKTLIVPAMLVLFAVLCILLGATQVWPYSAPTDSFAPLAPYLPGQPKPAPDTCEDLGYWGGGMIEITWHCRFVDTGGCRWIAVAGSDSTISTLTGFQCSLRLGDLLEQRGMWRIMNVWKRTISFSWPGMWASTARWAFGGHTDPQNELRYFSIHAPIPTSTGRGQ